MNIELFCLEGRNSISWIAGLWALFYLYFDANTDLGFHGGSHHVKDPGRVARYAILNQYHVSMVAYFTDQLDSIEAGEGTLPDNSLTMYGSHEELQRERD